MIVYLDKQVYSKTVILKAAYQFLNSAYIHLSQSGTHWIVEWTPKDGIEPVDGRLFENAAIEQQLRQTLVETTAEIRKLVLARAYASTVIVDSSPTESSPSEQQYHLSEPVDEADILKGWHESDGNRDV